jgi:hypothetical protein
MTVAALIGAASVLTGCDSARSSNPLSPNIAAPLAGVTITTPVVVGPLNAVLLPTTDQPITLTFGNAHSNSVRPFTYEVQLAIDVEFSQILLEITDIAPTETDQVLVVLAQTLASDQVYYWHVRALDGANTGAYSVAAAFEMYTPVVIAAPVVVRPTGGATTPTNTPNLIVTNAEITGPTASIMYRFELSTEQTFATPSAIMSVTQAAGSTTSVSLGDLPYKQIFYWRARVSAQARNDEIIGPWTPTASFRTPVSPVIIAAPTPLSPINGITISTLRPTLIAANGIVNGETGTVTYQFEINDDSSFASPTSLFSVTRSPTGRTGGIATVDLVADRQYFWRVLGTNGTLTSSWSATATFLTAAGGGIFPLPDMSSLVQQVAAENPSALANSCQDTGGSWDFMDLVVDRLRQTDARWGFNCKRGNCGDISQDIVDYHWGEGSASGSTEVYIIDIINGHCGPNPSPAWHDVTEETADAGTIGRWIFPR